MGHNDDTALRSVSTIFSLPEGQSAYRLNDHQLLLVYEHASDLLGQWQVLTLIDLIIQLA